ncbi:4Fe-4S cluster-binding domain-containing protein, partial [Klebsiella pneumoniae]
MNYHQYYPVDIVNGPGTRCKRQGLSLSGGDPLHPQNVAEIIKLVQRVRAECPGKDIWVWTG